MFAEHQRQIGAFAQQSPDNMFRVAVFVLATIQQNILTIPDIMRDIDRTGSESRFLWGWKHDAYEWWHDNRDAAYNGFYEARDNPDPYLSDLDALNYAASLPGMGLVKGGFMVQLMFGAVGCIDRHNKDVFEVPRNMLRADKFKAAKPRRRRDMARNYLDVCLDIGGAEFLWDRWCELVGKRNMMPAWRISKLHVECIL